MTFPDFAALSRYCVEVPWDLNADQCAVLAQIAPVAMILLVAERGVFARAGRNDPQVRYALSGTFFGWFLVLFLGIWCMSPTAATGTKFVLLLVAVFCGCITLGLMYAMMFSSFDQDEND